MWDRGSFSLCQVHDDLAVVKTVLMRETQAHVPIKTWNCSCILRRVGPDCVASALLRRQAKGRGIAGCSCRKRSPRLEQEAQAAR